MSPPLYVAGPCRTMLDALRLMVEQTMDKPKEPPKPNFAPSGLLAKETNTVQGVQLKYNEPPEARKPLKNWRLYVFKGKDQIGTSSKLFLRFS